MASENDVVIKARLMPKVIAMPDQVYLLGDDGNARAKVTLHAATNNNLDVTHFETELPILIRIDSTAKRTEKEVIIESRFSPDAETKQGEIRLNTSEGAITIPVSYIRKTLKGE